jgi:hypothetical protein
MAALCLTACAETTVARRPIPAQLLEPVEVRCAAGTTERALGECALRLRAGLETANDKLTAIKGLVTNDRQ